jgi:hypothetical protein
MTKKDAQNSKNLTSVRQQLKWHYIIPDDYQGYLAIHYNCPNGQPLDIQSGVITIRFNVDGTFCTSDSTFPTSGPGSTAETGSGQPIPRTLKPHEHSGYAFCCESSMAIGGNTQQNPGSTLYLDILWVGHLEPRPESEPLVPDNLHEFLQTQFGLQDIREHR